MESTKGFFGKLNHSIFGMIKEFGAAKRKARKDEDIQLLAAIHY